MNEVTFEGSILDPSSAPSRASHPGPIAAAGSPWSRSALLLSTTPDNDDDVPARRHLLRDVADRFMASYTGRDGVSRNSTLAMWVAFLGDRYIDEITPNDVAHVIDHLRREPIHREAVLTVGIQRLRPDLRHFVLIAREVGRGPSYPPTQRFGSRCRALLILTRLGTVDSLLSDGSHHSLLNRQSGQLSQGLLTGLTLKICFTRCLAFCYFSDGCSSLH